MPAAAAFRWLRLGCLTALATSGNNVATGSDYRPLDFIRCCGRPGRPGKLDPMLICAARRSLRLGTRPTGRTGWPSRMSMSLLFDSLQRRTGSLAHSEILIELQLLK